MYTGLHVKYLFLLDFNENWIFWKYFRKYSNFKFHKNPSNGGGEPNCFHAERQTFIADYPSVAKVSKNSIFCRHNAFLCFVWTSEKTGNISLYNMKILNSLAERQSVYCAARTRCLYVVQVVLVLERLILSSDIRVGFTNSLLKAFFRTYPELMSLTFLLRFIAICSHEIKKKHSPGYASRLRGYIQQAENFP